MSQDRVCSFFSVALILLGTQAPVQAAGDPAKGKEVFEQCVVCHHADSEAKKMGPGLKGYFKKKKMADGKPLTEANVRARIDKGGNGMPAYDELLTKQEKDHLIAYMKTL